MPSSSKSPKSWWREWSTTYQLFPPNISPKCPQKEAKVLLLLNALGGKEAGAAWEHLASSAGHSLQPCVPCSLGIHKLLILWSFIEIWACSSFREPIVLPFLRLYQEWNLTTGLHHARLCVHIASNATATKQRSRVVGSKLRLWERCMSLGGGEGGSRISQQITGVHGERGQFVLAFDSPQQGADAWCAWE